MKWPLEAATRSIIAHNREEILTDEIGEGEDGGGGGGGDAELTAGGVVWLAAGVKMSETGICGSMVLVLIPGTT